MRSIILGGAIAAALAVGCADTTTSTRAPANPSSNPNAVGTTTTTSAKVPSDSAGYGWGYGGAPTEYKYTDSWDGSPYQGNIDPTSRQSNRTPRQDVKDVKQSSVGESGGP